MDIYRDKIVRVNYKVLKNAVNSVVYPVVTIVSIATLGKRTLLWLYKYLGDVTKLACDHMTCH